MYATMFTLLIGTSATSFAAERSLPGDILYPVKTNFNEEIVKSLSITKSQKAKTNVKLVDKRMSELTEMVVKEKDTPEKIDIIVAKLEEHREDLEYFIENLEENNKEDTEDATEIYAELESVVDAHIDILEEIKEDKQAEIDFIDTMNALDFKIQETSTLNTDNEEENALINSSSTKFELDTNIISEEIKDLIGEDDALTEITNFSIKITPIINSVKAKIKEEDIDTSTKIKEDTRKKIIEDTEKKLQIDIDGEVDINSNL